MNKREAKRWACRLAADGLQSLLNCGWPFEMVDNADASVAGVPLEDEDGNTLPDGHNIESALEDIIDELDRRGGR